MKRVFLAPFIILLLATGCAVKNAQSEPKETAQLAQIGEAEYDKYFTGETMRFDFQHSGNSSEEHYSYDRMKREGEWAGSRKALINPFGKNKETACLGGAILAGVGAGIYASVKDACKMIETDKVYTPQGNDYSGVYENFLKYDSILNVRA